MSRCDRGLLSTRAGEAQGALNSPPSPLRSDALSGFTWTLGQQLFGNVLAFGTFVVLARMLEPKDFGVAGIASLAVVLLSALVECGLGNALIQQPYDRVAHRDSAFVASMTLSGLAYGVLFLAAPFVASLFGEPQTTSLLRVVGLCLLANGLSVVPKAVLRRALKFRSLALSSAFAYSMGGFAAIAAALLGLGAWSIVIQQVVTAWLLAVALLLCSPSRPRAHFDRLAFAELRPVGLPSLGTDLLSFVNSNLDNVMIGLLLGPVALGYYSVAYRCQTMLSTTLVGSVSTVALPIFARLQSDGERFASGFRRAATATSGFAMPVFAILGVVSGDAVEVFFGPGWGPTARVLSILCLLGILQAPFYFNVPAMTASGRASAGLATTAIQAIGNLVAFLVATRWGIEAVAAALVARAYLQAPFTLWLLGRTTSIPIGPYVRDLVRLALIVGGGAMAASAVQHLWSGTGHPVSSLLGSGLAGFSTYACLVAVFDRSLLLALRDALRSLRRSPALAHR